MPYDILEKALKQTNVGYLNATAQIFGKDLTEADKKHAIKSRLDPIKYLSQLVPDARELLSYMRTNGIILSGSRATAYFTPSACTNESDWDFYIPEKARWNSHKTSQFIKFLKHLGVSIVSMSFKDTHEYFATENSINTITELVIQHRTENKIQLVSHSNNSSLSVVLSFDLSINQCIFTGYCAISLYHQFTKNNETIDWKINKKNSIAKAYKTELEQLKARYTDFKEELFLGYILLNAWNDRTIKYIARGIKIVDCIYTRQGRVTKHHTIPRLIDDTRSLIIEFNDYDIPSYKTMCNPLDIGWIEMGCEIYSNYYIRFPSIF